MGYDWQVDDYSEIIKEFSKQGAVVLCANAWDESSWNGKPSFNSNFTLAKSNYTIHIHFAGSVPRVKTAADMWGRKVANMKVKTPGESRMVAWPVSDQKNAQLHSLSWLADSAGQAGYPRVKTAFTNLHNAWELYKANLP